MSSYGRDEIELIEAYERGDLRSVGSAEEREELRAAARSTGMKDKRVNIRISSAELNDIQARALEEGVPYQTLISSVLHKYATGRLVEVSPTYRSGHSAS